ncbi:MAG: antitoxin [Actinomycetota bacterium]|nr:antitoxin [Actinomycetota bacterium]
MADVLIRGISDDVLAAIDASAVRLGLSRSEYLRRRLAQDVAFPTITVEVADFQHFSKTFADLGDAGVMAGAWD